ERPASGPEKIFYARGKDDSDKRESPGGQPSLRKRLPSFRPGADRSTIKNSETVPGPRHSSGSCGSRRSSLPGGVPETFRSAPSFFKPAESKKYYVSRSTQFINLKKDEGPG